MTVEEKAREYYRGLGLNIGGAVFDAYIAGYQKALSDSIEITNKEWASDWHEPNQHWYHGWRDACMTIANELRKLK